MIDQRDHDSLEARAAKYANNLSTVCFRHAIITEDDIIIHAPEDCPRCKEDNAMEQKQHDAHVDRLRHLLKVRRFCLRVRGFGLFLTAFALPFLPGVALIGPVAAIAVLAIGVRSDMTAIAGCTRELAQLSLPPARLVRGSE